MMSSGQRGSAWSYSRRKVLDGGGGMSDKKDGIN